MKDHIGTWKVKFSMNRESFLTSEIKEKSKLISSLLSLRWTICTTKQLFLVTNGHKNSSDRNKRLTWIHIVAIKAEYQMI